MDGMCVQPPCGRSCRRNCCCYYFSHTFFARVCVLCLCECAPFTKLRRINRKHNKKRKIKNVINFDVTKMLGGIFQLSGRVHAHTQLLLFDALCVCLPRLCCSPPSFWLSFNSSRRAALCFCFCFVCFFVLLAQPPPPVLLLLTALLPLFTFFAALFCASFA